MKAFNYKNKKIIENKTKEHNNNTKIIFAVIQTKHRPFLLRIKASIGFLLKKKKTISTPVQSKSITMNEKTKNTEQTKNDKRKHLFSPFSV